MKKLQTQNVIGITRENRRGFSKSDTSQYHLMTDGKGAKIDTVKITDPDQIEWVENWIKFDNPINEDTSSRGYSIYYTKNFYNGRSKRKLNDTQRSAIERMIGNYLKRYPEYSDGDIIKADTGYGMGINTKTEGILKRVGVIISQSHTWIDGYDRERTGTHDCLNLEHPEVITALKAAKTRLEISRQHEQERNAEVDVTTHRVITTLKSNGLYRDSYELNVRSASYWGITIPLNDSRFHSRAVTISANFDVSLAGAIRMDTEALCKLQKALATAQTIIEVLKLELEDNS